MFIGYKLEILGHILQSVAPIGSDFNLEHVERVDEGLSVLVCAFLF